MATLEERIAAHNRGETPRQHQAVAGRDHPPGYTRWKRDGNFSREIPSSAAKSADDLMAARRSYGAKRQSKATSNAPKASTPSDPLAALRAAVRARGEAEAAVSAALLSVREAGGSMTKAAAALGVSRQAAYKALERAGA